MFKWSGFVIIILAYVPSLGQIPKLEWSKTIGSVNFEHSIEAQMDEAGNIFHTGWFRDSVDLDPGSGVSMYYTPTSFSDFFVQKLDSAGNLIWAHGFGGTSTDWSRSLTLDKYNNVHVSGWFRDSVDFDPGPADHTLFRSSSGQNLFVMKLDNNGNFKWAKTTGSAPSSGNAEGMDIITDDQSNVYVTGMFQGTINFDPGTGNATIFASPENTFLLVLDSSGLFKNALAFSGGENYGRSLQMDQDKNLYIYGFYEGTVDFDPGVGIENRTSNGISDVYLVKLDSTLSFQWVKTFGGNRYDIGLSMLLDSTDELLLTGSFYDTVDFDPGPGVHERISNGSYDAFLMKLDVNGNFMWVQTFGGDSSEYCFNIVEDAFENYWLAGRFFDVADMDPGPDSFLLEAKSLQSVPSWNVFLSQFSSQGDFMWSGNMAFASRSDPTSIMFNQYDEMYITGHFSGKVDTDPSIDSTIILSAGSQDIFISKFSQCMPDLDTSHIFYCDSYTWNVNQQTYLLPGTYTEKYLNSVGCDSNRTLVLIETSVDTTISYNGSVLTAFDSIGSYQWVKCDSNYQPISGAQARTFQPTSNGNYAVIISRDHCTDTSACLNVGNVGLNTHENNLHVVVYPNPTTGEISIETSFENQNVMIVVKSISGQILDRQSFFNQRNIRMTINQSPGIYFLEVHGNDTVKTTRLIVK